MCSLGTATGAWGTPSSKSRPRYRRTRSKDCDVILASFLHCHGVVGRSGQPQRLGRHAACGGEEDTRRRSLVDCGCGRGRSGAPPDR